MADFSLSWMEQALLDAGLKVAATPGWRTRGRGEMGSIKGVICHHTATKAKGNMPSLKLITEGRPDLGGPLAQLGLGRDGTFYLVAAGRANHAGAGQWGDVEGGNTHMIGIEAENAGDGSEPWSEVQLDAYKRGVAALLAHVGVPADMCCGHKEYARPSGRKVDPDMDMEEFRAHVAGHMKGVMAVRPPIPAQDDKERPTLRRGDSGDAVREVQAKVGVAGSGTFDAGTEAAVREAQRDAGMVADGIVGPKTWAVLDKATAVKPVSTARVITLPTGGGEG